jgi:threonine/homoserine/homoserine lactone efflux protein
MTLSALLVYVAVYFAAVATPGPGIAALVARVIALGLRGVVPFILGFVVGDLIWLTIAATGLALVARTFATAFFVIKILGAVYLLYIAWGLARAKPTPDAGAAAPLGPTGARAFLSSLSLTLGNPKVMVFFLSIMPLVVDVRTLTILKVAELASVSAMVIFATLWAYALAANRARAFLSSTRAMRFVHRAAGGLMAGVAVAVAAR